MSCQSCGAWDGTYTAPYAGTLGYCYGIAATRIASCGFMDNWQIDVQWRINDHTFTGTTGDGWTLQVHIKIQASFDPTIWTQVVRERIYDMTTDCDELSAASIAHKTTTYGTGGVGPCGLAGLTVLASAY